MSSFGENTINFITFRNQDMKMIEKLISFFKRKRVADKTFDGKKFDYSGVVGNVKLRTGKLLTSKDVEEQIDNLRWSSRTGQFIYQI